jgi:hypothetical protein
MSSNPPANADKVAHPDIAPQRGTFGIVEHDLHPLIRPPTLT